MNLITRLEIMGWGTRKPPFSPFSLGACDTIVALAGWAPPADPARDGDEKSLQTHEEPLLQAIGFEEMC